MPTFKIEPLKTTTQGGHTATIMGINTGSSDFIVGNIQGGPSIIQVSWDISGICRDNTSECNLNTHSNEFIEVVNAAKVFLPK